MLQPLNSIAETNLCDVVVIGNKGFGSEDNFVMLAEAGLCYVVPLKRNSSLFDADRLKSGDKAVFDGYFCLMNVRFGFTSWRRV